MLNRLTGVKQQKGSYMDYSQLLQFCNSDKQRELVRLVELHGNPTAAAKAVKADGANYRQTFRIIKTRAAKAGIAPESDMTKPAAEGFAIKGVSSLYDADGVLKAQWVKTTADSERQAEAMQAMIEALKEDIPKTAPTPAPNHTEADLLCQYVITDYHLGMYAWREESGEDWDLSKAESLFVRWFERAASLSPKSSTAVLAQLGDFLHWDGMDAVTPSHGHILDADTRFQKVIRCCIRIIRRAVQILLNKHETVHLIMATGNHDLASSAWMRELFSALYDQEPRVSIDTSADVYYCLQHGKTALMYHHGHKRKPANIAEVLGAKFKSAVFGSDHVYTHMGHLHHNEVKESALMQVEQHRTLAPKDAYASAGGWMSGRDSKVITYHKEFGEVSRLTISPDMV